MTTIRYATVDVDDHAGLAVTPRPDAPALEPEAPLARAGGRIVWKREVAPGEELAAAEEFVERLRMARLSN
jgi:hypothetical protein